MAIDKQHLEQIFNNDYPGSEVFINEVIKPIFGDEITEVNQDIAQKAEYSEKAKRAGLKHIIYIGDLTEQNYSASNIALLDVTIDDRIDIERSRVNIQRLIRSIVDDQQHLIIIFHYEDVADKQWRFSYAYKGRTQKDTTSAKRYTYVFGQGYRGRTAADRFYKLAASRRTNEDFEEAFSVEALSDEFFDYYRAYYATFVEFITGEKYCDESKLNAIIDKWKWRKTDDSGQFSSTFERNAKDVRDYIKKMFGRIIFLYFLQRKGWLYDSDGNSDSHYMRHLFDGSGTRKDTFLDDVLELLFFYVLNTKKEKRIIEAQQAQKDISILPGWSKIPFLNGGLFSQDEIDPKKCKFPAEYFDEFFSFLDSYNFTIDENDPEDAEIGIDPEMLGRIFENLLEDNKDKGTYYTPKEIVEYMCRESIIAYLQSHISDKSKHELVREFVTTYDANLLNDTQRDTLMRLLESVKICDPAIGSGAFPMGMINLLSKLTLALNLEIDLGDNVKRKILEENIYGVDIEKGAVDIARLRFWLAMVVDDNSKDSSEVTPLPNLQFKIMQGNSLLETYKGVDLRELVECTDKQNVTWNAETAKLLRMDVKSYYETSDHEKRAKLLNRICNTVINQLSYFGLGNEFIDGLDVYANDLFFLWHTWFADVFEKGGFDIVIGNPPYVSAVNMARTEKDKKLYKQLYPEVSGAYDLYILFLLLGCRITSNIFCWIVPNKVLIADYAKDCVAKLKSSGLRYSLDVSSFGVFKTASVYPVILLGSKSLASNFEELDIEHYSDLLINKFRVKEKILPSNFVRLTDFGLKVCSGATGFEATMLKQYVLNSKTDNSIPFTVSGNIDPYIYNNTNVRYMKGKYDCAHIVLSDDIAETKIRMWKSPKIVIAGMTKRIEACYVEEALAIGVGCYAIFDFNGLDPYLITGIINSKPVSYYLMMEFKDKHLAGGYLAINKSTIEQFLLPKEITEETSKEIARLSKTVHRLKKQGKDTSEIELKIDIIISKLFQLDFEMFKHVVTKEITQEEYENYEQVK